MEAVLLCITPAYSVILKRKQSKASSILDRFKTDIDRPLSAILSLNTIAHTVGAAEVGAQAHTVFGENWVAVTSAILTFLILVLSEIVPKTIGATYWRILVIPSVYIIQTIVYIMYPFTVLSHYLSRVIAGRKRYVNMSQEEFSANVDLGTKDGVLNAQESCIVKNTIRLRSLHAKDIMTPRIVIVSCSMSDSVKNVLDKQASLSVSRILMHDASKPESIIGYVHKDDLRNALSNGREMELVNQFKRPIISLVDTTSVGRILKRFITEKEHIAVLIDEYGGLSGLVTLEDIIETLLGEEIVDEFDTVMDMQSYARKTWQRRARRMGIID
jgi:CBS domain containing-hemolysin-like protein